MTVRTYPGFDGVRHLPALLGAAHRLEPVAEQLAQLVLAGQPERLVEGHRVQRPLGGAVEPEQRLVAVGLHLDGEVADPEDLAGEQLGVDDEAVAGRGLPEHAGVAKEGAGELDRDHRAILTQPTRAAARCRPGGSPHRSRCEPAAPAQPSSQTTSVMSGTAPTVVTRMVSRARVGDRS